MELAPDASASATVLVTNTSEAKVSRVTLTPLASGRAPADATVTPKTMPTLRAGETRVVNVDLAAWSSARPLSPLILLATFRTAAGVRQAASTSLELLPPAPFETEKAATVAVKASLETLRSDETAPIYLLVTDTSAQTLTVRRVKASGPDFIEFENLPRNVTVQPGETKVLVVQAKADSEVDPGEHQLVFEVVATVGGVPFNLVATQSAKVGVAGEAELLTVLGIPSVLILPGFLILAMASLLWRLRIGRQEWDGESFPFPFKEPEYWLLAVLLSIAAVAIASRVGIDLLGRYGLRDVVVVWIGSVVVGAVAYFPTIALRNRLRTSRVPAAGDEPLDLLRKLARQGLRLKLPRISVALAAGAGGGSADRFLVQPFSETRPSTWVSPFIEYTWTGTADADLDRRIRHQLDKGHDPAALAGALAEGERRGLLTVSFAGEGGQASLSLVEKSKIEPLGASVIAREA